MLRLFHKLTLTQWILVSMVGGIVIGVVSPDVARELKPLSDIFLRMIQAQHWCLVSPLMATT
jgi:proton glutamate symport protein